MTELDQLMEIMGAAFDPHWREAWTRGQVENSLSMPHTYAILCDADGEEWRGEGDAAGFVLARRAPGEEELLLIGVRPTLRGQGVGGKLLGRFADIARANGADRVFLEMRANNPARSLYESAGFEPIGSRRQYYRTVDGELLDAITFAKKL